MTNKSIRALGEVALRVQNLDRMVTFYHDVIGLELMAHNPTNAFFHIAEGFGGHTQLLALFDRSGPDEQGPQAARTPLDHFAFTITLEDYEPEKQRLEGLGLQVRTAEHGWTHFRSMYVLDPEGNQVELVCYDPSV